MDDPILSAELAALEITELLLPYIGMVMIVIFGFMLKDFATKMSKGIAFSMNKQFQEGDHVLIDGERALIVKIGLTQTVFGVTKSNGEFDGDYVWRYVPNERIEFLKEKDSRGSGLELCWGVARLAGPCTHGPYWLKPTIVS